MQKRFELLHGSREKSLADVVSRYVSTVSPETEIRLHQIDFGDSWDFEQVYEALFNFDLVPEARRRNAEHSVQPPDRAY